MHSNVRLHRPLARLLLPRNSGHALSPRLAAALHAVAIFAACWLFTAKPLLFSVNPLALALIASAESGVVWGVLGIAIGLWQTGASVAFHIAATALTLLLRLALRLFSAAEGDPSRLAGELRQLGQHLRTQLLRLLHLGQEADTSTDAPLASTAWSETLRLRVLAALVGGLIPALGIPITHGFLFYDLCGAVLYLVLLPLATVLFHYALDRTEQGLSLARAIGLAALLAAVCFCGRTVTLLGLSPVICLVLILTLETTARYGLGAGAAVGVVGGLSYAPLTVPIDLAVALSHALLSPMLGAAVALPCAGVALLVALLSGGATVWHTLAPSLVVGILCDTVWRRLIAYSEKARVSRAVKPPMPNQALSRQMAEEAASVACHARIASVSTAFGSLAEMTRSQGAFADRPDADELRAVLDGVMDEHCPRCPHRTRCWSEEYSATAEGLRTVSHRLVLRPDDVEGAAAAFPTALRMRCPVLPEMLGETRYRATRLTSTRQGSMRAELLADAYDAIAHLLRDVLHESAPEHDARTVRGELAEAVLRALDGHGIRPRHVLVTGDRVLTVRICGISPAALTLSRDELRDTLSKACGVRLSRPRYDGAEDGTLTLRAEPRYRVECHHMSRAAIASEASHTRAVCGDTLRTLVTDHGLFYALLSDGMGSGRQAGATSGVVSMLLERLLGAGVSIGTALRLVNHFLRTRADRPERECSSTIDLLEIDLYTGQSRLVKSGAAPSILLHGGRIYRLTASTVPLGILGTVDTQITPLELSEGDRVLLLSDGVTDTAPNEGETGDRLDDFLANEPTEEDASLAEALLAHCRAHGSLDDATVAVLRVLAVE